MKNIKLILSGLIISLSLLSGTLVVNASDDGEEFTLSGVNRITSDDVKSTAMSIFQSCNNIDTLEEPKGKGTEFVMISRNRKANSEDKQTTLGFEISELDYEEVDIESAGGASETVTRYVNPEDEKYASFFDYTDSSYNGENDFHYYPYGDGNGGKGDRVSFIINKYYVDTQSTSLSGRSVVSYDWVNDPSERWKGTNRLILYSVTQINYEIVKKGVQLASYKYYSNIDDSWYSRWLEWEESDDDDFAFGFGVDSVKTIYNGVTLYRSADAKVVNGKITMDTSNSTDPNGKDNYNGNDLFYKYPGSNPLAETKVEIDDTCYTVSGSGWQLTTLPRNGVDGLNSGWYACMANGIYNIRRYATGSISTSGISTTLFEGVPQSESKTGNDATKWYNYKSNPFLSTTQYTGKIYRWNNYLNDGAWKTYGWEESYKKYFYTGAITRYIEPEDTEPEETVASDNGYLTKGGKGVTDTAYNEDSPIKPGTSGDTASGDTYSAPNDWTYNIDDTGTYDIGEGIPTTESYTNYIDESTWYGTVKYKKNTVSYVLKNRNVTVKWTHYYYLHKYTFDRQGAGGTGSDGIHRVAYSRGGSPGDGWVYAGSTLETETLTTVTNTKNANSGEGITSTRTASFYSLYDIDIYELYSSGTLNKSLNNNADKESTNYTSDYTHSEFSTDWNLPYQISIDGNTQIQTRNGATTTTYANGTTSTDENATLAIPTYYNSATDKYTYTTWQEWNTTNYLTVVEPSRSDVENLDMTGTGYWSYPSSTAYSKIQTKWNNLTYNMTFATTNDTCIIAGISYIDNIGNSGVTASGNTNTNINTGLHYATLSDKYEMKETSPTLGLGGTYENYVVKSKTNEIPVESHNGTYYTNLDIVYKRAITSTEQRTLKVHDIGDEDSNITTLSGTKDAIKPGYERYEGVVVFSPVIAPVSIAGESQTQLADTSSGSAYNLINQVGGAQFILDHTYTISFDGDNWNDYASSLALQGYDGVSGYQKYIRDKLVSFPFSVEIISYTDSSGTHNVNKYYEPTSDATTGYGTGYTEWINLSSTATSIKIYIPTWAEEGAYTRYSGMSSVYDNNDKQVNYNTYSASYNKSVPAYEKGIRFRVEANNIPTELVGGQWVENENVKADKNYVATFCYPCQISGIIYEFEIDSIYDSANWASSDWEDEFGLSIYNFVTEAIRGKNAGLSIFDAEKRVGTFNRLGTNIVRYSGDGDTTNNWETYNTLGLMTGKRAQSTTTNTKAGYLVAGQRIAFTVKTIANLDDSNDGISIKPSFTYYDTNGNKYTSDQIEIWYKNDAGDLVLMGSTADSNNTQWSALYSYPYNVYYDNSYYDYMKDIDSRFNTYSQTAHYDSCSVNELKNSTYNSYSLGSIYLSPSLRLITANEEEMARNLVNLNDMSSAHRYSSTASNAVSGYDTGNANNTTTWKITNSEMEDFGKSMQTWYGIYDIPNTILVHIKDGTDTSGNGTEMDEYLETHRSIDETSDYWTEDGSLALYFDITSVTDGDSHLSYYGSSPSSSNMWQTEKGKTNSDPSDDDPDDTMPDGDIPDDGFIGIIERKFDSVSDHYKEGILYMN